MLHLADPTTWGAAAWQNECDLWLAMGQAPEAHGVFRIERTAGMTCAWWQRDPSEMDNYLHVPPDFTGDPHAALAEVLPQMESSPAKTYLRWLHGDRSEAWIAAAAAHGFSAVPERMPLMAGR